MPASITGSDSQTGTSVASLTSASLSWNSGDTVVVMSNGRDNADNVASISTTGSGLSFTVRQQLTQSRTQTSIWTAVATATSSGTITINYDAAMDSCQGHFVVTDATAFEASGGSQGNTTTPSTTVTPTSSDTLIIGIIGISQQDDTISAGSGYTQLFNIGSGTGGNQSESMSQHKDETSTGSVTFDDGTFGANRNWVAVCVALTAPAAAGGSNPPYRRRFLRWRGVR